MAIAGGGMPSYQVRMINGRVEAIGAMVNVPSSAVEQNMLRAASRLLKDPTTLIRVDALKLDELRGYVNGVME